MDSSRHLQIFTAFWREGRLDPVQERDNIGLYDRQITVVACSTNSPAFDPLTSYKLKSNAPEVLGYEVFGYIESGYLDTERKTYICAFTRLDLTGISFQRITLDDNLTMGNGFTVRFATPAETVEIRKAIIAGQAHFNNTDQESALRLLTTHWNRASHIAHAEKLAKQKGTRTSGIKKLPL
jgi:hypothetical protein